MNTQLIIDAINRVHKQDSSPYIDVYLPSVFSTNEDAYIKKQILNNDFDYTVLLDVLKQEPMLKYFDGGLIRSSARQCMQTSYNELALWLLEQSADESMTKAVVDDLREFCEKNGSVAHVIICLSGIDISDTVELGDEIKLMPFVRESKNPAWNYLLGYPQYRVFKSPFWLAPSAGIVAKYYISPMLIEHPMDFDPQETREFNELSKLMEKLFSIIQVLTLCGPCSPKPIMAVYGFESRVPILNYTSREESKYWHEMLPLHKFRTGDFNVETAVEITNQFQLLGVIHKENIRVALQRLNYGISRSNFADQAIELGIAFESILGEDKDPEESITKTIRNNGALVYGGTKKRRKEISQLIKDVYEMRSIAVHSGMLDSNKEYSKKICKDRIWEGIELCAILIRKIMASWSITGTDI
jgi:hypothetical protein